MCSYSGAHEWVGYLPCAWLSQFFVTFQIEQCLHLDILISNKIRTEKESGTENILEILEAEIYPAHFNF